MCLTAAPAAFPTAEMAPFAGAVAGYRCGSTEAERRIAILPDIYGCSPFYKGLAARYAARGAGVFLVDPFAAFGELPEATREAAFARRHRLADRAFVDRVEQFCGDERITGVVGFCLGGLYVFELARRNAGPALVGLYGFPQGMPNQDPLPVPFDYLAGVRKPFTMLMGADDVPVGLEAIRRLTAMAPEAPAMALTVYEGVGHNFLAGIDDANSADSNSCRIAIEALARMDAALDHPTGATR